MYSPFKLATKYFHYVFTAKNGKGHGIHSPFVYDFVRHVLSSKTPVSNAIAIESIRACLLENSEEIAVTDFGAGGEGRLSQTKTVSAIAKRSLKPKKYAHLLYNIVSFYKPAYIIELGTSLGITTAYLAFANPGARLVTFEGSSKVAAIAKTNFKSLGLENIEQVVGNFDSTFPHFLLGTDEIDFIFFDGNHRKRPTLQYFTSAIATASGKSIFVFDDIHWSEEMEEAWEIIKQNDAVTLSIDLFFIGLVFFNPDVKIKQHFKIRY